MWECHFSISNTVFPKLSTQGERPDRDPSSSWVQDSAGDGDRPRTRDQPFNGLWNGYIATNYNGGRTWLTLDATTNDGRAARVICNPGH